MLHSIPMSWATPVLRAVGLDWKSRGRRANLRTFRDGWRILKLLFAERRAVIGDAAAA